MEYRRGSLRGHEELKARILANPELVGINKRDVISVETEYPLTKRKHAIARPDTVIFYNGEKGTCRKYTRNSRLRMTGAINNLPCMTTITIKENPSFYVALQSATKMRRPQRFCRS